MLLVLFGPAVLVAYLLKSMVWLVFIPVGITVLALIIAALPIKRKVSPEQFADELEKHLLGTGGPWDWDDATSVVIADPKLEKLRWGLSKFDRLSTEKERDELRAIIKSLRRGEVPEATISAEQGSRSQRFFRFIR